MQRECAKNHVVPLAFSESVLITFLATLSEKSFWDILFWGWGLGTCRRAEPRCQRWDGATQKDTAETPAAGGFSVRSSPRLASRRNARQALVFALQFITKVCHGTMGSLMWNITLTIFYIYVALFISKGP